MFLLVLGIAGFVLNVILCFAVRVLLFIHITRNWGYDYIEFLTKQSVIQRPIAYFKVDNDLKSLTNQHSFFYWEGTYMIWDC